MSSHIECGRCRVAGASATLLAAQQSSYEDELGRLRHELAATKAGLEASEKERARFAADSEASLLSLRMEVSMLKKVLSATQVRLSPRPRAPLAVRCRLLVCLSAPHARPVSMPDARPVSTAHARPVSTAASTRVWARPRGGADAAGGCDASTRPRGSRRISAAALRVAR